MIVEIHEVKDVKLKSPVVIEGFPGIGMVGTIGASYLAETLGMTLIAHISSSHFPPIAAVHDYVPVSPARIYASEKHDLIVLFSEFVIPPEVVYPLTQKIIEFAKAKKAKAIYSLAAIASPVPDQNFYAIASTKQMGEMLKKAKVELVREGATQGVSGLLIAECANRQFPAANLMIQTGFPLDPVGAARLLDKTGELTGRKFDTAKLRQQGQQAQEKLAKSFEKIKELGKDYEKLQDNPMYG